MPQDDPRVGEILAFLQSVAGGNFTARLKPSEALDEMDAISEGLNMLAEEIEASTVSIDRYRALVAELQVALADIKVLNGMLPICAWCKQIRDDEGYWTSVEAYISERSDTRFTHGICPQCKAGMLRTDDR